MLTETLYKNMNETSQKGLLTELQCQTDFSEYGVLLSQPIINDSRYDFIADINGTLYKIQCKTCAVSEDKKAISFPCSSKNWNSNERKPYTDEIDYFYTCYNKQGYLIPISEVGKRSKILRFSSDQSKNLAISWAKDYEIKKILQGLGANISSVETSTFKKRKTTKKCLDCGKEISHGAIRCEECN